MKSLPLLVGLLLWLSEPRLAHGAEGVTGLSHIFYLGDSYLDAENYLSLIHATTKAYALPWSTVVNIALGLPDVGRWTSQGSYSPLGDNYAVAGAGIGFASLRTVDTSLHGQIARFLQDYPQGFPSRSVVVVGIGTNDVRTAIEQGERHGKRFLDKELSILAADIELVSQRGSPVILVLPPPTNILPEYNKKPTQILAKQAWNYLYGKFKMLASQRSRRIWTFDLKPIFLEVFSEPKRYGFRFNDRGWLGSGSTDPNEYMFWDWAHPSGSMHRLIAERFMEFLRAKGLL